MFAFICFAKIVRVQIAFDPISINFIPAWFPEMSEWMVKTTLQLIKQHFLYNDFEPNVRQSANKKKIFDFDENSKQSSIAGGLLSSRPKGWWTPPYTEITPLKDVCYRCREGMWVFGVATFTSSLIIRDLSFIIGGGGMGRNFQKPEFFS